MCFKRQDHYSCCLRPSLYKQGFQRRLVGFKACVPPLSRCIFSLVTPSAIHLGSSSIREDLCCCMELRAEAGATSWWRRPETMKGEIHVSRLCYPNYTIAESLSAQPGKHDCGSRQSQRSFDFIRWFWLTSAVLDSFWGTRLSKSFLACRPATRPRIEMPRPPSRSLRLSTCLPGHVEIRIAPRP